jgi:hypothetical protein
LKYIFPEDKVTENDQDCILEELGKGLRMTKIELSHLTLCGPLANLLAFGFQALPTGSQLFGF